MDGLPPGLGINGSQLEEVARMLTSLPQWQSVKSALQEEYDRSRDQARVMAAGIARLREVGLGGETFLDGIPPEYARLLAPEQRAKLCEALEQYMLASAMHDIINGEPLPIIPIAGGDVRVETHVSDGIEQRVVTAYATVLGDPLRIAAEFVEKCRHVFPESFATYPNGQRDAEWWSRHRREDQYRDIALSDPRSGLSPEAVARPDEYPDEVNRATDLVRRAVRRFEKRWTDKVDTMSKADDQ